MKEESKYSNYQSYKPQDTASILKVRLDSNYILERVRIYLTGKIQTVVYDDNGKPLVKEEIIANPKANNEGIQAILNYVENVVNSQTVQGNMKFEQYENYIAEVHEGLIINIMNNLYSWGIKEDNYEPIIDNIMVLVIPFVSRIVDNLERDSYTQTIKAIESNTTQVGREGIFK